MTLIEAAQRLRVVCENGERLGRKKEAIVLFGMKYAEELKAMSRSSSISRVLKSVAKESRIAKTHSYYTELGIGVNLAEYVTLKGNLPFFD